MADLASLVTLLAQAALPTRFGPFNAAVFEELLVRDGRVAEARYRAPFDLLFAMPRFEYQCLVEAPGIEPGSEAAFHATSTSVVPVLISPEPRPGTRLGFGQSRCMSRPAPRRHRAARLLALTSGPAPTAEKPVDVRPKPELFSSLLLTQRGRGVRYSHVYFSRFYEPGARLAFARPTTPSKPVRPHGNAAIRDQRAPRS